MIDMNRAGVGTKFGVSFMDLSAAYDSINRDPLFAKLKHRGMSDHSIDQHPEAPSCTKTPHAL
jgi:hypothetical protein